MSDLSPDHGAPAQPSMPSGLPVVEPDHAANATPSPAPLNTVDEAGGDSFQSSATSGSSSIPAAPAPSDEERRDGGSRSSGGATTPSAPPQPERTVATPADAPIPEARSEAPIGVGGRPLPRVIAIANQKGGVGKTTTTVNMGASLAELDHRTLVIDLDPQGNATTGLGINYRTLDHTMYDVLLHDVALEDCIEPTEVRNLFVAPASLDLAGAEIELVPAFSRESRLKRAVAGILDDYDFILIDCPPSLGLLTVNGLVAATEVMVPIQCEYYALEGLAQLTRNVDLVRTNLNPGLEISGIVMVMYDGRTRLAEQVVSEVRGHFGAKVCRNMIPRNIRLSEAPSYGQPITTFDPSSRGAVAYRELAREVSGDGS